MLRKTLVVSPHPDDETLGVGGTLLKLKQQRSEIFWINLTNMHTDYGYSQEQVVKRREEILKVREIYGVKDFFDLGLKPAGLDEYPKAVLVNKIKEVLDKIQPQQVFIPFMHDAHSDHQIAFNALWSALKSFRCPSVKDILMYETPSETDFAVPGMAFEPNTFCDIGDSINKKIDIMRIYASEIQPHPFPRSEENIRSWAIRRGAQAGCNAAEAFMVLKRIL